MTFDNCICFQLGRLSRKITREYRDKISAFNLTHAQFFVMMAVIEFEGDLPSRLAEKTDSDRATITGLIDRLERDGWVERRAVKGDRRALSIFLSPRARRHKADFLAIFDEINRQFKNRYTSEEWSQLQCLLEKLE